MPSAWTLRNLAKESGLKGPEDPEGSIAGRDIKAMHHANAASAWGWEKVFCEAGSLAFTPNHHATAPRILIQHHFGYKCYALTCTLTCSCRKI